MEGADAGEAPEASSPIVLQEEITPTEATKVDRAVAAVQAAQEGEDQGEVEDDEAGDTVEDFSSGHYEVLSSYVVIVETKLVALTGTGLTLAALLLSSPPEGSWPVLFSKLAALLFGISALCGIIAFYPRRYTPGTSVVYWEDIQSRPSAAAYQSDLANISPATLERDFSFQNFYISKSLHFKYRLTRWCIIFLIAGLVAGFVTYALVSNTDTSKAQLWKGDCILEGIINSIYMLS